MRVILKSVIDIRTGETLYEDTIEYDGPIALCGGGGAPETQTTHTTSTEKSSPWKPQIPYLKRGFQQARANLRNPPEYFPGQSFIGPSNATQQGIQGYGQAANRAGNIMDQVAPAAGQLAAGNGLGMGQLKATAGGEYLGAAPFMQAYGNDIKEGINAGGMGYLDSGQHQKILSREMASAAARMFGEERDRMVGAAGELGNAQRGNLTTAASLAGAAPDVNLRLRQGALGEGYQQRALNEAMNRYNFGQNAPNNQLAQYMQAVAGNYGGTTTGSGSSTSPVQSTNPWAAGLGGAAAGAGIGNMIAPGGWGAGLGALGGLGIGFLS